MSKRPNDLCPHPGSPEVDPDTKLAILGALVEARAPAGATLLEQDQPNDHLSFLIDGTARSSGLSTTAGVRSSRRSRRRRSSARRHSSDRNLRRLSVRATSDVWMLSLYHPAHEALRVGRIPAPPRPWPWRSSARLSERFDLIDRLFSDYMARHPDESSRMSEWAGFRARLFDESGL